MRALPVDKRGSAWPGANTMPDGSLATATVLRSTAVGWSVTEHQLKYADCFNVSRFKDTFLDGRNVIIYDRRGVSRDTDNGS